MKALQMNKDIIYYIIIKKESERKLLPIDFGIRSSVQYVETSRFHIKIILMWDFRQTRIYKVVT